MASNQGAEDGHPKTRTLIPKLRFFFPGPLTQKIKYKEEHFDIGSAKERLEQLLLPAGWDPEERDKYLSYVEYIMFEIIAKVAEQNLSSIVPYYPSNTLERDVELQVLVNFFAELKELIELQETAYLEVLSDQGTLRRLQLARINGKFEYIDRWQDLIAEYGVRSWCCERLLGLGEFEDFPRFLMDQSARQYAGLPSDTPLKVLQEHVYYLGPDEETLLLYFVFGRMQARTMFTLEKV